MKIFTALILVQLALNYSVCYSQDYNNQDVEMNKEIEEIIQLALKLIDEKASVENFTKIQAASLLDSKVDVRQEFSQEISK